MTDQDSPTSHLQITDADIAAQVTADNYRDTIKGVGTDLMNLRSLQQEVDVLEAKAAEYTHSAPRTLQAQLDAKRRSLAWQKERYKENQREFGGLERRDAKALNAENNIDAEMLKSARETDIRTAVSRVMQKEGLSKFEALQMINMEIAQDGAAAEAKYLPQYFAIKARTQSSAA